MNNTPNLDKVRAFIERREALLQSGLIRALPLLQAASTAVPAIAGGRRPAVDKVKTKAPAADAARRTVVRAIHPGGPGFEQLQKSNRTL